MGRLIDVDDDDNDDNNNDDDANDEVWVCSIKDDNEDDDEDIADNCERNDLSSMVNFMITNKNKLVQLCLENNTTMDLYKFDQIFNSILYNDIDSAFNVDAKITAVILNIFDRNNIY